MPVLLFFGIGKKHFFIPQVFRCCFNLIDAFVVFFYSFPIIISSIFSFIVTVIYIYLSQHNPKVAGRSVAKELPLPKSFLAAQARIHDPLTQEALGMHHGSRCVKEYSNYGFIQMGKHSG